jgi:putative DNA primase/helicase
MKFKLSILITGKIIWIFNEVMMKEKIEYSLGRNKFDNLPEQFSVDTFEEFIDHILKVRGKAKGEIYFSSAFNYGEHDDLDRFSESGHYRLKKLAKCKKFLALDFDWFEDFSTMEKVLKTIGIFKGIGYTTWSHTTTNPRLRAVLQLDRLVNPSESVEIGLAIQRYIERQHGASIKLDKSVYSPEHMIYGPSPDATIYNLEGEIINVDNAIATWLKKNEITNIKDDQSSHSKLIAESLDKTLKRIDFSDEPTWSDVANILARVYGEEGRNIFIKFSEGKYSNKGYSNFDRSEVDARYDRALREAKIRKTGFGITRLCELANLTIADVDFEDTSTELIFRNVDSKNRPYQVTENIAALLDCKNIMIRYNQIKKKTEIDIPNFKCASDEKDNAALTYITDLAIKAGLSAARVDEMTLNIAAQRPYCPVQEYIESNSWDGQDRLTPFINQIHSSDQVMCELICRKWLIQAVAAIYEEKGLNSSGVLVITGKQGIGKTRFFKDLTHEISDVFLEGAILSPSDKDSVLTICSNWIVELGELDATFKKSDIAQLKAFLTKNTDTVRKPYAKKDSIYPRRTVFAGTVNNFECLNDPTGNRRFWVIDVDAIKRDPLINYQQLWAQIKNLYDQGEDWHFSHAEQTKLDLYSKQFLINDIAVEKLLRKYDFVNATKWEQKTMSDICSVIFLDNPTKGDMQRMAAAIREFNGNQKPKKTNGINYHFVPL